MTHHVAFESEDKSSSGETNATSTQKGKPRKDARRDRGVLEQGSPSSDDVLFPDGIALMPASNLTALLKPAVTGDESEEDHDSGCWGYSAVRLLPADSAPSWTVRPYIHSGYRGVLTLRQALSSVSYCHNETGNVVTHLLGLLIFMGLLVRDLFFRGLPAHHRILACSYLLVAQICMGMSTAYHLLGPISKRGFDIALRCDITGIALSIICSFMIGLHYGFWCHERIGNIYLIIVGTLSVVALVWPHIPALMGNWNATIIFYGSFVGFCPVPIIHWLVLVGGPVSIEAKVVLYKMLAGLGCYVVGFVFWQHNFPEQRWPGAFDLVGHSHQIWHILVFFGICWFYYAVLPSLPACLQPTDALRWINADTLC